MHSHSIRKMHPHGTIRVSPLVCWDDTKQRSGAATEPFSYGAGYISAWVNKGYALGKLKRYEEEISCYDRALKIYPFYFSALHNRGIALINQKNYRDALETLDCALAINPLHPQATLPGKALPFQSLGLHDEAILCLRQALSNDPTIADAWVVLSNSCFALGRLEESATLLIRHIILMPTMSGKGGQRTFPVQGKKVRRGPPLFLGSYGYPAPVISV